MTLQAVNFYTYVLAIPYGVLLPDTAALRDTAETLAIAEQSADDVTLFGAQAVRGITLVHQNGPDREVGFGLLAKYRERALSERFSLVALPIADIHVAREKTRIGDLDGAVELSRGVLEGLYDSGGSIWSALATTALVEALLARGADGDLADAQAVIDRLAAVPTDPGCPLHEITLLRLRALVAQAHGNEDSYRDYRDCYRALARRLGFEGHIAMAEAMP